MVEDTTGLHLRVYSTATTHCRQFLCFGDQAVMENGEGNTYPATWRTSLESQLIISYSMTDLLRAMALVGVHGLFTLRMGT